MLELFTDPQLIIAFFMLTALEIVLGIDNVIFISIIVSKLPKEYQNTVRRAGLLFAMFSRIALLFSLAWIVSLTKPLFTLMTMEVSGRDLVLFLGGLFLIYKAVVEIYHMTWGAKPHSTPEANTDQALRAATGKTVRSMVIGSIIQIGIIDIIFSLDSVITAVGMVSQIPIMVAAVVASVLVMLWASKPIGEFVDKHPSVKMLALAFLVLVGLVLMLEGVDIKISKSYVYAAMIFSIVVEVLNLKVKSLSSKSN